MGINSAHINKVDEDFDRSLRNFLPAVDLFQVLELFPIVLDHVEQICQKELRVYVKKSFVFIMRAHRLLRDPDQRADSHPPRGPRWAAGVNAGVLRELQRDAKGGTRTPTGCPTGS